MTKKILVVDDDALVLKTVKNLLVRESYEIECAKNGDEAAAFCETDRFNLIICDIRMPGQDGLSVVKNLKNICLQKKQYEPPCIFITGYASEDAPIDAIKLGARDYLLKPFDLNELIQSVRKHIA